MGMYPWGYPNLNDDTSFGIGNETYLSEIQKLAKDDSYHIKSDFSVIRLDYEKDLLLHADNVNCPRIDYV